MFRCLAALLFLQSSLLAQTILVLPYLQPGNGSTLTGRDTKVLSWVTDQIPGAYTVLYSVNNGPALQATPQSTQLDFLLPKSKGAATPTPAPDAAPVNPLSDAPTDLDSLKERLARESSVPFQEKDQHYLTWHATLNDLPFDSEVHYVVKLHEKLLRQGVFHTRATTGKTVRFVAVGDLANGKTQQKGIAWQISQQKPDFMIGLGDLVYSDGRVGQYMHHFWTTYNDVPLPGFDGGAPLFATIPFYPVMGNHDVDRVKLPDYPDAYGAYYFFHVPQDGPGLGPWSLTVSKDKAVANAFRAKVGAEYPALNVYSWDYGPGHFVALDSNTYVKVEDPKFRKWLEDDLTRSRQPWKFVCFHAPAFHSSREHYTEQKMRLLEPIFEKCGVDVVFAGHVHNYQRSKPLRFTPITARDSRGRVNGETALDEKFDGVTETKPDGIIHIVSGGGGAALYKIDLQKTMEVLKKEQGVNYVPLTAKCISDKNSFSVVDLSPSTFSFRQISITGEEVDRFSITKNPK